MAVAGIILGIIVSGTPASAQEKPECPKPWLPSIERPHRTWDYDGKRILGHVGYMICLWDATTGKLLQKMQWHKEHIFAAQFSPDGIHALSSSWMDTGGMVYYKSKDTRTIVWNLTNGEHQVEFPEQVAGEFSPDGSRIVTFSLQVGKLSSFDANVWDAINGRQLAKTKLDEDSTPVWDALHFSPDGLRFAFVKDGAFRPYNLSYGVLYEAKDGKEIGRSTRQDGGHRFTSSGALASFGTEKATLIDVKSGQVISSFAHGLKPYWWGAVWTHDGKRVAAIGDGEGKIKIWDIESKKMIIGAKVHPKTASSAIVSPDNARLAIESGRNFVDNPEVRLYDMTAGKEIARIKLAEWGHMIGFSPDGKTLLVGGSEFIIYESETGKKIRALKLLDDVSFEHDWYQ